MKGVSSVISRFGTQELAIRRAYAGDPEFRELCDYHVRAMNALAHWSADEGRAGDYRRVVEELEEEILEYLSNRNESSTERGTK